MKRVTVDDPELTQRSIEAARRFLGDRAKQMDQVKQSFMLNGYAHGFYMGARHRAKGGERYVGSIWRKRPAAADAANHYLKVRFPNAGSEDAALLRSSLEEGFEAGFTEEGRIGEGG